MKTRTENILVVLKVITWIALIGFSIEAGSQLISFLVSLKNPVAARDIPGVDQSLFNLYQYGFRPYVYVMSFVIALSVMKVYVWLLVLKLLSKLNMKNPFTIHVSKKLEAIAYQLFGIWVVNIMAKTYTRWLSKSLDESLNIFSMGDEFLFIAGIVYIISQVFKRGIEIQEENQLTV